MEKTKNRAMLGCAIFLCLVMAVIFVRFAVVKICAKKHINNAAVQAILCDNTELQKTAGIYPASDANAKPALKSQVIDWAKLYPFEDERQAPHLPVEKSFLAQKLDKLSEKIASRKKTIEKWATNYLPGYLKSSEWANLYKGLIHWNIARTGGYNSVVEIEDNQLTAFEKRKDMPTVAKAVIAFAKYCELEGAKFIYVAAPDKIGRQDTKYSGAVDFSNQNTDEFLAYLKESGVRYIDLRDNIEAEDLVQRNLFFKTDHHWLPETGLWVSKIIAEYLNENELLENDVSLLNPENFRKETYERWFLGSHGRKVTLAKTTPDDISLLYPKFEMSLQYMIPNLELKTHGNFDVIYQMDLLSIKDYYKGNAYGAYNHSDRPYIMINNTGNIMGTRILMIKDSFANCVAPFISLICQHEDILDLRHFTGSVKSFLTQSKPDIVVVLYHNNAFSDHIQLDSHKDKYDFR